MKPYAQYCPISRAAEAIGDRWSTLIVRDMLTGNRHFNDLARGLPGISRALLSKRLKQLEQAGIVARADDGWDLTNAGQDLKHIIFGLAEWGARWTFDDPRPEELDPNVLVWWMHTRIDRDKLPPGRITLEIEFTDIQKWYWLVLEPGDVSVCITDPGYEVDVTLSTAIATLYKVWLGRWDFAPTLRDGLITLDGRRDLVQALPGALQWSPAAYASARLRGSAPA